MIKIASYLQNKDKFSKYRVVAELDQNTNDFPRDESGSICTSFDDLYIRCRFGNKIYSYGHGVLVAYIPSLGRGHNILNKLDDKIPFDIVESDSEIEFKFKYKDLDLVAELLHAHLSPKDREGNYHYISPYSQKNINKLNVKIPDGKLEEYKKLTANLGDNHMQIMRDIAKDFLKTLTNRQYKADNLKADIRKTGLKNKEYIYYIGKFDEYLNFIKKKGL